MSRSLSGAFLSAMVDTVVRPVFLVKLEFTSANLYLNTSNRDISFSAQTWLGNGILHNPLENFKETDDVEANGLVIRIDCLDAAVMGLLLSELTRSKACEVYQGLFDTSYALIADPVLIFKGYFNSVEFDEDEGENVASISYEHDLLVMKKTNHYRYTHESQQLLYAGDKGFEFVAKLPDWSGFWGKAQKVKRIRKRKLESGKG